MIEGITSYIPAIDTTSIGSLNYSQEERIRLAKESVNFVCPQCGAIREICEKMKSVEGKEPSKYNRNFS